MLIIKRITCISKWNLSNTNNIYSLFYGCSSLKELPDISKWDLNNVNNISGLFCGCSSLKELPDISKWNLRNVRYFNNLFFNCSSLISLPDISKWELFNSNINNYDFDLNLESKFSSELNDEEFLKSLFPRIVSYHNDIYLDNIMIVLPKLNSYKKENETIFFKWHL